jgi:hypothetical protein
MNHPRIISVHDLMPKDPGYIMSFYGLKITVDHDATTHLLP